MATFSNYGTTSVDVGAPGVNIYSTIATSATILNETFESITTPGIPSGWTNGGTSNNWGTYDRTSTWGEAWGKVLYGDLAASYANNANTSVTSSTYNLGAGGTNIDFWTACDTEYTAFADYMSLEYSSDGGSSFTEILKWDEPYLDYLNGDSSAQGSEVYNFNGSMPSQYSINNFKLRFRWVTNSSGNAYDGCAVDDIKIIKYSDGSDEQYGYMNGTSMATPHVAGLAALIEGYNPDLTSTQVKDIILSTGDTVSGANGLVGKTVTGKRINANNALLASAPLSSEKAITAFSFSGLSPVVNGVITGTNIAATVPFGINVTALVPTIVMTGVSINPASGASQNFTNPVTYTVTAADSTIQAYVVTVTLGDDPVATVFDEISATLEGNDIANNLDLVESSNVASFSGLYFEKSIGGTPVGKLTFTGSLNLSSTETKTFLENLGTKLEQSEGRIALDARESAIFTATGATLVMYDMPLGITSSQLIVRDDSSTILDASGIVSNFTQATPSGDISFNTAHFTQFDIDTTKPIIAVHANVGPIEATSPSGAVATYTVPNATDNIDPTAPASCSPISGSTFSLGPTTVMCNKTDTAGNAATPTTFTVTVVDTTSPSTPGTPSTTSPTNDTTPTWTWTAASDIVGIDHYIFYWDAVSGGVANSSGSLLSGTLNFTHSSALASGTWYGKVRAFDANGNSTVSAVGSVVIDANAPIGNIAINSGAAYTNSNNVTLNFSGVSTDVTTMELGNGTSGRYQSSIAYENPHAYTLPNNGDGTYTVRVRFTDSVGNVNNGTISDTIILDETSPTDPADVHSTSHTATPSATKTIDMAWTTAGSDQGATDSGSGVDGYSYSFTQGTSDVPDTNKDAEETATTTSSSALADGSWYFHLRTLDNAVNWTSTVHVGPFVVDTTKPVIASHVNITTQATSASGAIVTYTAPLATDNVDATTAASCDPASGSTFPIGITAVTCTKTDTAGNSATPTTFTVTVAQNPPTLAPIGNKAVDELTTLTFTATATDPDSTIITYSLTGAPTGATIDNSTGVFNFTPAEAQGPGTYTLTVNATDGTSTDSEEITITVNEVNVAPVAIDVSVSTPEDTTKNITLSATDTDFPAQGINYFLVTNPAHGTVDAITDGKINYTPSANYTGADSFTYKANDGSVDSNIATVSATVNAVNDAPVANDDTATVDEDTTLTIAKSALLSNDTDVDGDTLSVTAVTNPTHGTVAIVGSNIVFSPTSNYFGPASFDYTISDGVLMDTATVSITVNSINDKPVAANGTISTGEGMTKIITLSATDSDVPAQSLTYSIVANPPHGTLSAISGDQITYTPNRSYSGSDSFTFKANDGTDDSNTATITITVIANPDAPVITSVATNNIINNTEKTAIHIIGTANANSLVTVTLTSGANTKTGTQQLTGGATGYDITINGHTAFPASLSDGTITVSATAANSIGGVSAPTTTTAIQDTASPTVTKLGDNSTDVTIAAATTATLTFNEPLSSAGKTAVQNALTAGADQTITYGWNGTNDIVTITGHATNTTTFANDVMVNASDIAGNIATGLLLIDSSLTATQTTPDGGIGNATINSDTPEVVITNPNQTVTIAISSGTTYPTIDVSSFVTGGAGTLPQITINSNDATISIPSATTVTSADPSWNGVISAPTVTTVTLPDTADETETLGTAIEIGFSGAKLSFDKAVRILLPGQAGKRAGYVRTGITFTEITSTCSADSQAAGDALPVDGECKIDAGADLVIWTKHFTTFATYSSTKNDQGGGGTSGGGGGGTGDGLSDGLSGKAHVCNDTKPGSAPTLLSAVAGTNSVTLTWSEALAPATYYLVTYGTGPGLQQFGNPNVGPSGTTSYTVSGLSGGATYYFRVRAGNGCKPGDFSNELSAGPGGGFIAGPAAGFAPGVLGATTEEPTPTPKITSQATPTPGDVLGTETPEGAIWPWWLYLGGFGSATIVGILKVIGLL